MEENLKLWKAMDFHEELTLDEINEFIEGSPEVPMSSQFVDKLIRPIVEGGDAVEREKALLFIERLESDGYFISE
ncbi:MAG: hypothetical protein PUH24_05370 [Prevotellaceae bacterium]|nr:hypothetical protein [Prevotella sp.]MDD7257691.1 hypothetical protein [Prevotellaceae bacterium]MDY6130732.1 hypothetical protein [Prevotella sp.]